MKNKSPYKAVPTYTKEIYFGIVERYRQYLIDKDGKFRSKLMVHNKIKEFFNIKSTKEYKEKDWEHLITKLKYYLSFEHGLEL